MNRAAVELRLIKNTPPAALRYKSHLRKGFKKVKENKVLCVDSGGGEGHSHEIGFG